MPSPLLVEIDEWLRPDHPHLRPDDRCLFLREYLAGSGFQGGETNSLILNLKKSPDRRARIFVLDDVLTTGAHFRVAKDALRGVFPGVEVIGLFVARRVPIG